MYFQYYNEDMHGYSYCSAVVVLVWMLIQCRCVLQDVAAVSSDTHSCRCGCHSDALRLVSTDSHFYRCSFLTEFRIICIWKMVNIYRVGQKTGLCFESL